jgi:hypothetical protein
MGTEPRRYELQRKLEECLGSSNVYFNPPEGLKISYPCIVYTRSRKSIKRADDKAYTTRTGYDVTLIQRDPDSTLVDSIFDNFTYIQYNRTFVTENLYHDVYLLYF